MREDVRFHITDLAVMGSLFSFPRRKTFSLCLLRALQLQLTRSLASSRIFHCEQLTLINCLRSAMALESYGRVALKEARRLWPFTLGFAVTGALILKLSLSLTPEDAKNSPFVKEHNR
ncbi:hypothetical protein GOP47_0017498 [Adiantum capillus-veneris]|uniref:Uncharacterized protein n=1 Tax=Adiantum capillus-veneris TaxID=13818 RepID=A0A9D4ZAU5_ADICA|nr:hypothetical protein GOP47_0017498 [Adiantum capillus-veneris]